MALKDVFKVSRKTFLDPSAWVGVSRIKNSSKTIWSVVRDLFIAREAKFNETFDEALVRMKLTEDDINKQAEAFYIYSVVFVTLMAVSFLFGFYLLFVERTITGFLLGVACTALFGGQAFRYHFWVFQIKQRRLGCTFEEWKQSFFTSNPGPDA